MAFEVIQIVLPSSLTADGSEIDEKKINPFHGSRVKESRMERGADTYLASRLIYRLSSFSSRRPIYGLVKHGNARWKNLVLPRAVLLPS